MKLWEKNVRKVEPYVAGEQPDNKNMVKLNTNECPYPPSPKVKQVIKKIEENTDRLRLYPDKTMAPLINALAEFYGVESDMVFAGVGSDDVIANCFLTFFNSEKPILFPEITYSFYPVWADLYKIPYKTPKLREDFTIDVNDYMGENGGIIIPNPNAPTSIYESLEGIEKIVKANPASVVIIDEAYIDFGGESAIPLVKKYDNLLVVQTFSKSRSMAGMRIGYAIGSGELIAALNNVKNSINSYTLNYVSILAGEAAVKDKEYFDATRNKIIETRKRSMMELEKLGFTFPQSKANFIFATHKDYNITDMFNYLRDNNIYVRHWNNPLIKDYLRITIGTDEEMNRLFDEIKKYMNSK
ncbi:MAG: histidinol-phosphate transaminase [Lachnospiraceae bacterium]